MDVKDIITAARGDGNVDLVLENANIINVFSGRIAKGSIAITGGHIVGFGDYPAAERINAKGRYVAPGFIDSHVHIESSMTAGIDYMLRSAEGQPMDCLFALPSCVPATDMETAGARLSARDLEPFMDHPRIVALAEMMNYPGVIFTDPDVLAKLSMARRHQRVMDGHAPGISGRQLFAYAAAGIASDHECTRAEEALEKLELGIHIMVREGTCARNLDDLFPVINENTWHRMMWCTDDRHPHDLMAEGHVDAVVRKAVAKGLDPVVAIRMGTINPADYFGIKNAGAIAPGRKANLVVFSDLSDIRAEQVFYMGQQVAENGSLLPSVQQPAPVAVPPSMNLNPDHLDFSIPATGKRMRIIRAIADQVITRCEIVDVAEKDGFAIADVARDVIKMAVVDRYTGKARTGKGFVTGLGLKRGAVASSVAHDSHNIIVAGATDADMQAAVTAVVEMGGGFSAVCDGKALSTLPLPIAGLMSDQPVETVRQQMNQMITAAKKLGATLCNPFMTLGFLALPVIPDLKLTDRGLVDVTRFEIVPLFV
ncbi:MAG: adenine deaminase [Desulfosarcina sp.]|nr:adenine deaminase [Desulfosarcina sp.]